MELLFVLLGIAILICIITLVVVKNAEMKWETRTIGKEKEMGATFYDLTDEELCELICGDAEDIIDEKGGTEDEERVRPEPRRNSIR